MNIEKADYGTIIKFGTLNDFLKKIEIKNESIENVRRIIDNNGVSLLEKSFISQNFEISRYLINNGAELNIISKDGMNEFHFLAANINNDEAVNIGEILLKRGVSLMQKEKRYGNTAFFSLCIEAFKVRSENTLMFLNNCIEYLTEIDEVNLNGYSIRRLINERGSEELKKKIGTKWK